MKKISACVLLCVMAAAGTAAAAGLDDYLVARWTFDNGTMESEGGKFSLLESGVGDDQTTVYEAGAVSLGAGRLLSVSTDAFDASRKKDLLSQATVWAKFKFEQLPASATAFLVGFRDVDSLADWGNMILALVYLNDPKTAASPSVGVYAISANGTSVATGPSAVIPIQMGEWITAAVVYDGPAQTATLWVNGKSAIIKNKAAATSLKAFTNFGLGRLKQSGTAAVTFDEVRIYSTAFTPEWIAEIAPEGN